MRHGKESEEDSPEKKDGREDRMGDGVAFPKTRRFNTVTLTRTNTDIEVDTTH